MLATALETLLPSLISKKAPIHVQLMFHNNQMHILADQGMPSFLTTLTLILPNFNASLLIIEAMQTTIAKLNLGSAEN